MQEILIGNSYALIQKNLADTISLLSLLSVITIELHDFRHKDEWFWYHIESWKTLEHGNVAFTATKFVPYRSDLWIRLWDQLSRYDNNKLRFKPNHIAEKLLVSLAFYQEALSRCSSNVTKYRVVLFCFLTLHNRMHAYILIKY